MRTSVAIVVATLLGSCGTGPPAPPVLDPAAAACVGSDTAGDWLVGRWQHPQSTLDIRRDGAALVFAWEREPGVVSPQWGEKAEANGRGRVTKISGCSVELQGHYTASPNTVIVGRELIFRLRLDRPGVLNGKWYGAGHTWMDTHWIKAK